MTRPDRRILALCALAAAALGTAGAPAGAAADTTWLCRPGLAKNPCRTSLDVTSVPRAGAATVRAARPARQAPIDCFYVYPTVSGQPTVNADLTIDGALVNVARAQAAPLSRVCRVFAPVYRQVTVGGLFRLAPGAIDTAYGDVRAAWREYLRRDNHGRGVVLVGHSQGTAMARRLAREEIDPKPATRRRLVSALLLGGNVKVSRGSDVGGDFTRIRACRSARQTGCVVGYSSFDATPPQGTYFGRVGSAFDALFGGPAGPGLEVLCVNPAAPSGGRATLHPLFRAEPPAARTPYVTYPGRYRARCRNAGGTSWLQVDAIAGDARPRVAPRLGAVWGLHGDDVGVALGDLVALVARQSAAYRSRGG